ncbi:MAG: hypothetical protein NT157_02980 [Candidatus Micrarchaeota archaeon]|nr:hypothetical protein [Candidatus Micrarchaeota archaeon]
MHAFISVGQCGGGVLDSIMADRDMRKFAKPLAINSASADFLNLKNIRREEWFGICEKCILPGADREFESKIVGGYGQNRARAERDSLAHFPRLMEFLASYFFGRSDIKGGSVPSAFLTFSLGGGTGSGMGPVVAEALRQLRIPTISLVVLPSKEEGNLASFNANASLRRLSERSDSIILADNQRIAFGGNMVQAFQRYNDYVGRSIAGLYLGVCAESIKPSEFEGNPPVIDISDVITATTAGKRAYACLARTSERTRGILGYFFPIAGWREIDVIKMVYQSFMKLTLEGVRVEDSQKNLVLVRMPHAYITKAAMRAPIDMIRNFMQERSKLKETHMGVALTRRNLATATLLVTFNADQIARLRQVEKQADEYDSRPQPVLQVPELFLMCVSANDSKGRPVRGQVSVGVAKGEQGSWFALPKGRAAVRVYPENGAPREKAVEVSDHLLLQFTILPEAKAQEESMLSVAATANGKPLRGVQILAGGQSAYTDDSGSASLSLAPGIYTMTCVHPKFRVREVAVKVKKGANPVSIEMSQ